MTSKANEAAALLARAERAESDREKAIRWANQSVEMLQSAFFPVADALRALEGYLRDTPHHNAPEAAAARKALVAFDAADPPYSFRDEVASVARVLWQNVEDEDRRMARENVAALGWLAATGKLPSWDDLPAAYEAMKFASALRARVTTLPQPMIGEEA